jgi:MFS family permease
MVVVRINRDPLAMGMIGLAEVIPAVSLALYAGHVIDRSDRRKVLLNGVMLYWMAALALLIISTQFFTHIW